MGKGECKGNGTQNFCTDGISPLNRLSSLLNVLCIALYISAMFIQDWSKADDASSALADAAGGDGDKIDKKLVSGDVSFSLDRWCMEVAIPNWSNEKHPVCFEYMDNVNVCLDTTADSTVDGSGVAAVDAAVSTLAETVLADSNDTSTASRVCAKETGCELFGNICKVRQIVKLSLAIAVIVGTLAAAFSEKTQFLLAGQAVMVLAGIVAMAVWVSWESSQNDTSAKDLKMGAGAWMITFGWLVALVALTVSLIEFKCFHDPKEAKGVMNDGIGFSGRLGSLLCVVVWIVLFVAVANPKWTSVTKLGNAGGFCIAPENQTDAQTAICNKRQATFGLWNYCVEEVVPTFPDKNQFVCLDWTTEVAISTSLDKLDGHARFDRMKVESTREFCGFAVIAAVMLAVTVDIFSEKLVLGAILMPLSGLAGLCAMGAWVDFNRKLKSKSTADDINLGIGGGMVTAAWLGAFVSFALYAYNYKEYKDPEEKYEGKHKGRDSSDV